METPSKENSEYVYNVQLQSEMTITIFDNNKINLDLHTFRAFSDSRPGRLPAHETRRQSPRHMDGQLLKSV